MIPFYKVQASGNDFIVFDSRAVRLSRLTSSVIRFLCHRHLGIGADGLIFIEITSGENLRMHYFNADGSEGEMCGNGLRAAARYARNQHLFASRSPLLLAARDGLHEIVFNKDQSISVEILIRSDQEDYPDLRGISVPDDLNILGYYNSGVPHLVLETTKPIEKIPLLAFAPSLRHYAGFKNGANINVIRQLSHTRIQVRTYERGVEAETLSCGTGVTASAMLLWQKNPQLPSQLEMETKGGILKVSRQKGRIILTGPATLVFVGKIDF